MNQQPKLVLGLPCFGEVHADTMKGLFELAQMIDIVEGFVNCVGTLLPTSRNTIVRKALEEFPEFTHLLFIDADMADFHRDHVHHLILQDKPIISALCTARKPPYQVCCEFKSPEDRKGFVQQLYEKDSTPVEVNGVGMAFTLIKREVFDAIEEPTAAGPIWFDFDRQPRDTIFTELEELKASETDPQKFFSLGLNSHIGSPFIGEDISFCYKAGYHGFPSYIAPMCAISHLGEYRANIKTHMMEVRTQQEAIPTIDEPECPRIIQ